MGVTAAAIVAAGAVAAAGTSGAMSMAASDKAARSSARSEQAYRKQMRKAEKQIRAIPQIPEFVYDPGQGAREYQTYVAPAAMSTARDYTAQNIGYIDQYLPRQRAAINELITAQLTGRLPQQQEQMLLQQMAERGVFGGANLAQAQRSGAMTRPQAAMATQYLRAGVDLIGQGTANYFGQIQALAPMFVSPIATAAQIQDQSRIALAGESLSRDIAAQNIANRYRGIEITTGQAGGARESRERGIASQLAAGQAGASAVGGAGQSITSAYGSYTQAKQAKEYGDFLKSFSSVYGGGTAGGTTGATAT